MRSRTQVRGCNLGFALAALLLTFSTHLASACSIPVFRYALDRWSADAYRLEISPADARDETVARFLRNFGAATPLNLEIVRLPAAATDAKSRLLPPHAAELGAPPVWSGTLDGPAITAITNSPARQEIIRRILDGDNVVWIVIESGNRAADDAAAAKLTKRLTFLGTVMQLPVIDPNDPSSQLGPGPALRVKFSILRIRCDDSAEQPLLAMLAGPKSRLHESREPWFSAVFGRGRALGAWPANGFGDEQVEEVSQFLLGACSCQVKRMNPGWDILLNVDWDESLHAIGFPKATATAPRFNASVKPETVTITGGESVPAPLPAVVPTTSVTEETKFLISGAAMLLLIGGVFAWRRFA